MVKQRMNIADVAAQAKCLRSLIGMRCSNVYDLSAKTYIFKMMKSSGVTESGESEKVLLLIESGIRLHTTAFARDKSSTPSGFTLKLRKHVRAKRLEEVRQLGIDRVVDFQFGLGEGANHIILELYAQGNILLTDNGYNVLTLLRSHRDDDKGLTMMVRHEYPVGLCRHWERTSFEKVQAALVGACNQNNVRYQDESRSEAAAAEDLKTKDKKSEMQTQSVKRKELTQEKTTLRNVLGEILGYGPTVSEHIILEAGFPRNLHVFSRTEQGQFVLSMTIEEIRQLHGALSQFENWLEDISFHECIPEGFIFLQKRKGPTSGSEETQVYEEFSPLMLNQYKGRELITMSTFDQAVDEFFSKLEAQRVEQQLRTQEHSASQKLDKICQDQTRRVELLSREVDHSESMAELIEYNLEEVDAAILAVRTALATGMDWKDLSRMVKEERKAGNPVASIIHSLQLEKNEITLLLFNNLDDMGEEQKTQPATRVEVDLSLSAHGNARRWFEAKKKHLAKQEKTVAAHEKAFKAAEKKTTQQLAQEKVVAAISHIRKVHWFEKFNWFVSSENYLIISGRDAQQNELLVKRYMKKGDLYVHADLHGASSTVIKNHNPSFAVPPLTLNQAGCFTVCRSQAWDSKIVTSAWWVYSHQVSKTAPAGEYLTMGSFMIRGKKNFLPPHPLVMGFGILFRLEESCVAAHMNDRKLANEGDFVESNDVVQDVSGDEDPSSEMQLIQNRDASMAEASSTLNRNKDEDEGEEISNQVLEKASEEKERDTTALIDINELMDKAFEMPSPLSIMNSCTKYGLSVYPDAVLGENKAQNSNINMEDGKADQKQRPYLSKAERRKLKKGTKEDTMSNLPGMHENVSDFSNSGRDQARADISVAKIARGHKGKMKKIKEKYAEQDEEERELRMALLASAGRHAEDLTNKKGQKLDEQANSETMYHSKVCFKCKTSGHLAKDCPGVVLDAENVHPTAHPPVSTEINTVESIEDGVLDLEDDDKEKLTELHQLTEQPYLDDILLYAVPVCGPYSALQGFKYRVKLTPGNSKKGKAAKTAMNLFMHMPEATTREKELMKALGDPELVAAMVGNAKVTAPGLSQLKHREKKGKKTISRDGD